MFTYHDVTFEKTISLNLLTLGAANTCQDKEDTFKLLNFVKLNYFSFFIFKQILFHFVADYANVFEMII